VTTAAPPPTVPLRPSHVLSTYAVGAFAGELASGVWLLPVAIIWSSLNPEPLPGLLALVVLSPLAGVFYVELLWWLPSQLVWRILLCAVITAGSVGMMAAAIAGPTVAWSTVALAFAIGATIPLAVRGVVWAFLRSRSSVMALSPGQSLATLFLVAILMVVASSTLLDVARAVPAAFAAFALGILGLGPLIWTVGLRPAHEWPRWFRPYGQLVTALVMAVCVVSALS